MVGKIEGREYILDLEQEEKELDGFYKDMKNFVSPLSWEEQYKNEAWKIYDGCVYDYENEYEGTHVNDDRNDGLSCSGFVCRMLQNAGAQLYLNRIKYTYLSSAFLQKIYAPNNARASFKEPYNFHPGSLFFWKNKSDLTVHHVGVVSSISDGNITIVESRRSGATKGQPGGPGKYTYPISYFSNNPKDTFLVGEVTTG